MSLRRARWIVASVALLALPLGGCATSVADLPLIGTTASSVRPIHPTILQVNGEYEKLVGYR